MRKVLILSGEGIECEKESARFFENLECKVEMAPMPKILQKKIAPAESLRKNDWFFLPGGFSFSDHFGSGRLLAYELRRSGLLEALFKKGVHVMGFCNGFQVLTECGVFGQGVKLEANRHGEKPMGFTNRWIHCAGLGLLAGSAFNFTVRHGEGRLTRPGDTWDSNVSPILSYNDPSFDNGSVEKIAGLMARVGSSYVFGLMPHPEIALRPLDGPDACGPEFMPSFRASLLKAEGDGVRFMKNLFKEAERE